MNFPRFFAPTIWLGCFILTGSVLTLQLHACVQKSMSIPEVIVSNQPDHSHVDLSSGTVLVVKLQTTPGLGYSWQIATSDPTKLQSLGDSKLEPLEAAAPGSIENQVFRFMAKAPGSSLLEFRYLRPWEQNAPPLKTYQLNINIK